MGITEEPDPRVRGLSDADFRIWAYARIGRQSAKCGLGQFSPAMAAEELGWPLEKARGALDRVCGALGWKFDQEARWLLIPEALQVSWDLSPKQLQGFRADIKRQGEPPTVLRQQWEAIAGQVRSERFGADTHNDRYQGTHSDSHVDTSRDINPIENSYTYTNTNTNTNTEEGAPPPRHQRCHQSICKARNGAIRRCMASDQVAELAQRYNLPDYPRAVAKVIQWAVADRPPVGYVEPSSDFEHWRRRWDETHTTGPKSPIPSAEETKARYFPEVNR